MPTSHYKRDRKCLESKPNKSNACRRGINSINIEVKNRHLAYYMTKQKSETREALGLYQE